jgi:hypothetical protein
VKEDIVPKVIGFDEAELSFWNQLDNVSDAHRLASPLRTQTPHATLKILFTSRHNRVSVLALGQIVQIRLAKTTANLLQVKLNVVGLVVHHGAKQVTAKIFATWATQSMPSPDIANTVNAAVTARDHLPKLLSQRVIVSQRGLNTSHYVRWQGFVDVG